MDVTENNVEPKVANKTQIGDFTSVEEFTKHGLGQIVEATKSVNSFPSGASRDLYCAYPSFGKVVDFQSNRILGIISDVLRKQSVRGNIQLRQKDEQFELLLECNDFVLERVNCHLDDMAGIRKNLETILVETKISNLSTRGSGSWNIKKKANSSDQQTSARLITAKNIVRPQVNFKIPVDNSPLSPFEPKIKYKPNSLKPLAVLPEYDEAGIIDGYLHPYEFELMKFEPPTDQLHKFKVLQVKPIETTPLVYIDTEEKLMSVLHELRNAKEIAVDLEHHSYRTFQGFTCLMQLTTRSKDYIIDALKLREELHVINEIFTNPKIVKIFHGADCDIEWLQRDLSLYVVNMFDTHQAAKLLAFPRLSLAYLLKHFCNIEADKTYQLADWRIRPLPEELIMYARQDTHHLIYIYEMLVNDLLLKGNKEANLLKTVYTQSTEICKKRYCKPRIFPESHLDLYRKSKRIFDNRQLIALKEIYNWRDKIARQEDESYGYVLPNHMMLQIAESLPREMQGILACCNPIPPLVRQNLHVLHQIILKAREQPLVKPIIDEQILNRSTTSNTRELNESLHCPHDFSQDPEFRDDLPTLLGPIKEKEDNSVNIVKMDKLQITVFDTPMSYMSEEAKLKILNLKKIKFVSPYERYKAAIPLAEKERLEELERQEALKKTKLLCPVKIERVEETIISLDDEKSEDSFQLTDIGKRKRIDKSRDDVEKHNKKVRLDNRMDNKNSKSHMANESPKINANLTNSPDIETMHETSETSLDASTSQASLNQSDSKKFHKNKKNKFKNKSGKTGQSSNQVVPFDYSKVDFKKFQGGSQKANKNVIIKSKFQGKGKNNKVNNKKFNKLFTFSNVNKKK